MAILPTGTAPSAVVAPPHFYGVSHEHEIMVAVEVEPPRIDTETTEVATGASNQTATRVSPAPPSVALPVVDSSVEMHIVDSTNDVRFADATPRSTAAFAKKNSCRNIVPPLPPGSAPALLLLIAILLIVFLA